MNKVYFLPLALAAAFSAVANETYTNIVTGVDSVSPEGVPTAVGGEWDIPPSVELAKDGDAVVFGTDDGEMLQLNITAAPADTNSYNAWDGTAWVVLDEVPSGVDDTKVTNLMVEVRYQYPGVRTARFTVGNTVLRQRGSEDAWITLYNNTSNSIAGLGFSGAGTLAKADASVMLGVAEYDGVKYGTLSNAVAAAASDPSAVINVVRETNEDVASPLPTMVM